MIDVTGHLSPPAHGATGVLRTTVRGQRRDVVGSALLASGTSCPRRRSRSWSVSAWTGRSAPVTDRRWRSGSRSWSGVFVVLASCGAIGYWLMDRARLRAGRDVRVRVAARVLDPAGGAPGRPGEQVGLASSDADRSGQIVTAYARMASAAGRAGRRVPPCCSRPRRCWPWPCWSAFPVVLVASRLIARPLVGRAEAEQNTLAGSTAAATDLVTGLRVLKGIGAEPAAAAGYTRASQTALRARLDRRDAEGGYLERDHRLHRPVAGRRRLDGRPAGPRRDDQHRRTGGGGGAGAVPARAAGGPDPARPLVAGARGAAGRVATFLAAPPAVTPGDTMLPEPSKGTSDPAPRPRPRPGPG